LPVVLAHPPMMKNHFSIDVGTAELAVGPGENAAEVDCFEQHRAAVGVGADELNSSRRPVKTNPREIDRRGNLSLTS
jgi:hypothetical protein